MTTQYRPKSAVELFSSCVLFSLEVMGDIEGANTRCNMRPQLTNPGFRCQKDEEEGSSIHQHVQKRRKPFWSECPVPEVSCIRGDVTDIIIDVKTIRINSSNQSLNDSFFLMYI